MNTSVGIYGTSYRTLTTQPLDLIYEKQFTSKKELNESYTFPTRKDNIRNLYIEFSDDTFVYEIQFSIGSLVYIKSETGEINLGNNITITRSIKYQIDSNKFVITIPNDKPTNRILVYQSDTNKLIHITDWIAKGTTQNITINYTNNNGVLNVTSSVTPANPLPVPNFNVKLNQTENYLGNLFNLSDNNLVYNNNSSRLNIVLNRGGINCVNSDIIQYDRTNNTLNCSNIYNFKSSPVNSFTLNDNNTTKLYSDSNGTTNSCINGFFSSLYSSAPLSNNKYVYSKCARLSI